MTTTLYRPDVILSAVSRLSPGDDIERFNNHLESEGLGQPLQPAKARTADHVVIPTTLDPVVVRNALKRLRLPTSDVDRFDLDYRYLPGAVGAPARESNFDYYLAAGCKTGHGLAAWLAAPKDAMPPEPQWQLPPGGHRPVIALLDEGVEAHEWLPAVDGDPFVEHWNPTEPLPDKGSGAYRGHATFNAGIIRHTAPAARVLSMPVMGDDGHVHHSKLVDALAYLARSRAEGNPVDVVCLPFGRYRDDDGDDEALETLRVHLRELKGIPVVASAGNDGVETPTYPAAFAIETDMSVISVGSFLPPTKRAAYSNFGVWVKEWRGGTNMLSSMPMPLNKDGAPRDGYAWWTGTSFAAVRYAGELAARLSIT